MKKQPTKEDMIERIHAALEAGLPVLLSEEEENATDFNYSHSYTIVARPDGTYDWEDWERVHDAAALPRTHEQHFTHERLRTWLGNLPSESLFDACAKLPGDKFVLVRDLAAHGYG